MPVAPVSLAPTKRLTVLILASCLFLFHLSLSSRLASFSDTLKSVLGNAGDESDLEGGEGGRLYGIITLVRIGRVSCVPLSHPPPRCRTTEEVELIPLSFQSYGVYVQLVSH